ncbi:MAG TPA: F0F1 ATP synthase subunit A [Bacteroidales bacterium]|nr:F0F1 ATP synthase subunit A [Bacteroidales bacterium]
MWNKRWILILSLLFSIIYTPANIFANEEKADSVQTFKPGEFIIDHILDDHGWHIATLGEKHISIPLPIIVYSYKQHQWHIFMSSAFHHGHESHNGLALGTEGDLKGKIIEVDENGNRDETAPMPLDLSITKNTMEIFIISLLLLWIFLSTARYYKKNPNKAPKKIASWVEPLILFVRDDIAQPSLGHKYMKFMPYLLTVFFFIFFSNLMGLIPIFPGGANLTGNIAVTMVLALFTFFITTFSANKAYWIHIFNSPGVPWWLKIPIPLMPVIELIGVFTKPFVLMVRLFANITAGHIIALGFFSLIFIFGAMNQGLGYGMSVLSVTFAVFMSLLELLVAFIQAYVFTLLSAIFFGMATEEHHHAETH